jgi:hypothetical protein
MVDSEENTLYHGVPALQLLRGFTEGGRCNPEPAQLDGVHGAS